MDKGSNFIEYLAGLRPKGQDNTPKSHIMGIKYIEDYFSILAKIEKTKSKKK